MPLTFQDWLAAGGASAPPVDAPAPAAFSVPPWLQSWTEGNANPDRDLAAAAGAPKRFDVPSFANAAGMGYRPGGDASQVQGQTMAFPENSQIAANGNIPPGVVPIHSAPPGGALPALSGVGQSPAPPWLEQAQQAGAGANVLAPGKPGPAPSWEQRQAGDANEQKQAATSGIEAKREKDQALLSATAANDAAYKQQVEQAHATYAKAQTEAQAATAKVRADADALSKEKIDPNRYFNQMSTMGKISSVLGLAMGGFVAPKMGGKNPAMDFIQSQIHNDIQSQTTELENRRGNLNLRSNLIAQQLGQGKDMFEATTTVAASYYQRAKDMVAAQAGSMTDGEAKAALQKTWADLDQQQHQLYDAHTQQMFANKMEQSKVGLGYAGLKQQAEFHKDDVRMHEEELGIRLAQANREITKENRGRIVPGMAVGEAGKEQPLMLATPEDRNKAVDEKTKSDELIGLIDTAIEQRQEFAKHTNITANKLNPGSTDAEKRLRTTQTQLLAKAKEMLTNGVLTETDKELIEQMIGGKLTGVADPTPGLMQMRQNAIMGTSRKFSSLYGQSVQYVPPSLRPPSAKGGEALEPPGLGAIYTDYQREQIGGNARQQTGNYVQPGDRKFTPEFGK